MKKIAILLLALSPLLFSAKAQETGKMSHHRHPGKHQGMSGLNLTSAQQEQLKVNRETTRKQLADLEKNDGMTLGEYKTKKAEIVKSQKDGLDKVLTSEQKEELKKNKADLRAKRALAADKKLDKMKSRLNLTDDQVARLKAGRAESQAKAAAIAENNQLSREEKKAQLTTLRKAQKENFRQVLTPEQVQQLENMKHQRVDKQSRK